MASIPSKTADVGEPTWEIAHLFPNQGYWSEGEYLSLKTNRLIELVDGKLEVLAMPTESHQLILAFLYRELLSFVSSQQLGLVLFAPLRVKVSESQIREPDIVFMLAENKHKRADDYWTGADLVIEIVSSDDPKRDLEVKRAEYAKAGISEYWIVDPRDSSITVLQLAAPDSPYKVAGVYQRQQQAASVLLGGFAVSVDAVFDAVDA